LTFDLSPVETANPRDAVIEACGLRFVVEKWSSAYADDLEIDLRDCPVP
jgi:hypothetical protein